MWSQIARAVTITLVLMRAGLGHAAEFAPYPGAGFEAAQSARATKAIRDSGGSDEASVFTTPDAFERVATFYASLGKEYSAAWTRNVRRLPDGRQIKVKVYLLDAKTDPTESKRWVQVQHPFIGGVTMDGMTPRYHGVRDLTVIVYTRLQ